MSSTHSEPFAPLQRCTLLASQLSFPLVLWREHKRIEKRKAKKEKKKSISLEKVRKKQRKKKSVEKKRGQAMDFGTQTNEQMCSPQWDMTGSSEISAQTGFIGLRSAPL